VRGLIKKKLPGSSIYFENSEKLPVDKSHSVAKIWGNYTTKNGHEYVAPAIV
jgi:hypothetical protein